MKKTNKGDQPVLNHLDDADLISHLDGELTSEEQAHAKTHLESCWTCRSHLHEVQSNIETFLRTRKQITPAELPPSGPAVALFRARLAQHSSTSIPLRRQLTNLLRLQFARDWFRGFSFDFQFNKAVICAVLVSLVVLLALVAPFERNTVSATELLRRANDYESRFEVSAAKVVRARVRMERIALATGTHKQLGEVQTASDNSSAAMYIAERDSFGAIHEKLISDRHKPVDTGMFVEDFGPETAAYLAAQGWLPEVSNSSYRRLINGRGFSGDDGGSVVELGDTYEVHHQFAQAHASRISKTVFVLDAKNYSPRSISIFTTENNEHYEYQIQRVSVEAIERTPEIAVLFEPATKEEKTASQPADKLQLRKVPEAEPPAHAPIPATATPQLEVEVLGALSQIDADLGQEVIVNRLSDGTLRVEAIVDTDERKRQILAALTAFAGNPAIAIEIETSHEASERALKSRAPDRESTTTAITAESASRNVIAVQYQVREYLQRRGVATHLLDTEVGRVANQVVGRSHRAMLHVWALKGLVQRFTAQDLETLNPAARAKWLQMIATHARRFQTEATLLRKEISAILNSEALEVSAPEINDESRLIEAVVELIDTANINHEVIRSAFTISNGSREASAITASQFWRSMAKAEATAAGINSAAQKLK